MKKERSTLKETFKKVGIKKMKVAEKAMELFRKVFKIKAFKFRKISKTVAMTLLVISTVVLAVSFLHLLFFRSIFAFVGTAAFIVVWSYSMLYLVLGSGYSYDESLLENEEPEISLMSVDKLWTEILVFILFIIVAFTGTMILMDAKSIEAIATLTFFMSSLFYFFFFSLVRRKKADILFKTSFMNFLSIILAKISKKMKPGYKIALFILLCLLIQGLLVLSLLAGSIPLLVVYLIFNTIFTIVISYMVVQIIRLEKAAEKLSHEKFDAFEVVIDEDSVPFLRLVAQSINTLDKSFNLAVKNAVESERMRAELITNVSHDIKTPLTSIISYVNLLRMCNIKDEKAAAYLDVLEKKSSRLAHLMNDLIDVSKLTSGNVSVEVSCINFEELVNQAIGELDEKFDQRGLKIVKQFPKESVYVRGDGRHMWRILDNLLSNASKYSMEGTRVYIEVLTTHDTVTCSVKNVSSEQIKVSTNELKERFVRGDDSRTSTGSGLGLSIAGHLAEIQHADLKITVDGDLFKVDLVMARTFPPVAGMTVLQ